MRSYTLIAPAKINLYLEILGLRPDGYHELAMIMQSISLADRITLTPLAPNTIELKCNHPTLPTDHHNLAYKAAQLMITEFAKYDEVSGVEIKIDKQIPIAAGLAGGSTDCAAVMVGLNLMWNLGLTQTELEELAARLGSDIPFCIAGGTVLATGRGEKLDSLPGLDNFYLILAKYKSISVSTAWAYQTYRQQFEDQYSKTPDELPPQLSVVNSVQLIKAIAHKDFPSICELLYNDLEKVVLPAYPKVAHLKEVISNITQSKAVMMSGSGPSVFALLENNTHTEIYAKQLRDIIPDPDLEIWIARFSQHGIHLI